RAAADAIAEQPSEQLLRRADRLAVERQQQIADEHASLRGRSAAGHADDQQRVIDSVGAPLRLRQLHPLPRKAEVAPLETAVLKYWRGRRPGDACRDDDAKTANRGCRRDPDERA